MEVLMSDRRCPFINYSIGTDTCKVDGHEMSRKIADNLCDSWNHEDCPLFKEATGKK
jgi:hypothetical protein